MTPESSSESSARIVLSLTISSLLPGMSEMVRGRSDLHSTWSHQSCS
jgi:hypothetical protein